MWDFVNSAARKKKCEKGGHGGATSAAAGVSFSEVNSARNWEFAFFAECDVVSRATNVRYYIGLHCVYEGAGILESLERRRYGCYRCIRVFDELPGHKITTTLYIF